MSENERLKILCQKLREDYGSLNAKIQNGEYVSKSEYEQMVEWHDDEVDERKLQDLIWHIERTWYFNLFGNLDKIKRTIALDKVINKNI